MSRGIWVTMDSSLWHFMRVIGAYRVYRCLWASIDGDGCMDVYGCLGGIWVSMATGVYACYGCLAIYGCLYLAMGANSCLEVYGCL